MKRFLAAALAAFALTAVAGAGAATRAGGHDGRRAKPGAAATLLAAPPLNWGVADDASKYADDGGTWFYSQMAGANLTENRWTLSWDPADPTAIKELPFLARAAPKAQAAGVHVVLALYGTDPKSHDPAAFCTWAASVATTVAAWGIHDYIVWNEPNGPLYWQPQKDAAGNDLAGPAYEALLARCYDTLHAADPEANVIGMGLAPRASSSTRANEPLVFLRDVGRAYVASKRTAPIMDQLALHPYPNPNSSVKGSPPDKGYPNPDEFGIADLNRVKQAVYDAFHGTGQPTTVDGLTFRLDEIGWQTDTTAYPQYVGAENARPPGAPWPVDERTQARYLTTMASSYFACDPTVTDVELFLLMDERYRDGHDETGALVGGGWQSGLMTAGGQGVSTPKLAYAAVAPLFAEGRAACTGELVTWTPGSAGTGDTAHGGSTTATLRAKAMKRCMKLRGKAQRRRCAAAVRRTSKG